MKKIIKKWADSNIIRLTTDEMEIYNLNVGDVIDIELVKVKTNKGGNKRGYDRNRTKNYIKRNGRTNQKINRRI